MCAEQFMKFNVYYFPQCFAQSETQSEARKQRFRRNKYVKG